MNVSSSLACPLCEAPKTVPFCVDKLGDHYARCSVCDFRFLHPRYRLSEFEEKKRYLEHNNDVNDPRYQEFMRPLVHQIQLRFPVAAYGLDFGAGTGPVLKQELEKRGYRMAIYDPFFWPDPEPLTESYDFICATEVAEHLFEPGKEFRRLRTLLRPGGALAIMTLFVTPDIDFANWYYRRDPTHVGFFSARSLYWLKDNLGFAECKIIGERIVVLVAV